MRGIYRVLRFPLFVTAVADVVAGYAVATIQVSRPFDWRLMALLDGSIVGEGMAEILSMPTIQFVETNVAIGPRTSLNCDAHDILSQDGIFDGVIIQAVLEHVADPQRCVDQILRIM